MATYRRCTTCEAVLPVTAFPGLSTICTACIDTELAKEAATRRRHKRNPALALWETAFGPLSSGFTVIYTDGNPTHHTIDNLTCCTLQDAKRYAAGWVRRGDSWYRPCPACTRVLPLKHFYASRQRGRCIPCQRAYANAHKETIHESH